MPSKNGVEGTLYTYANNPRAQIIQIAAQYGASDVKIATDFEFGVTDKSDAFTSKFPFGQVPAFECAAGCLNDTMAIASYVGGPTLRGEDDFTRAQITQFVNVAENKLFPAACQVLYPCWGLMPNNKNVVSKGHEQLKSFMTSMDKFLEPRTYLVGECVTLADIVMTVYMRDLYSMMFDESSRASYVNVTRWFDTIVHQDEVVRILGETSYCVKPAQFDAKLFNQNNPKQKKEAAPKKDTPKKEQPKKEEAKPAAQEQPKQEKKKPFADLAPTTFDMDSFKRLYWNESTEAVMSYFDEHCKAGGWSVWTSVYKFPMNKQTKANNLCKGIIQRLETFRKFGFGILYSFGDEPDLVIAGVWLGRGDKNFFLEDDNWNTDMDNFELKKVDIHQEEGRALWMRFVAGNVDDWEGKLFNKDFYF